MALRGRRNDKELEDDKVVEISAQMEGSLTFSDPVNLKITGSFNGTLVTKGTLTIGETATVEANIKGDNIVLAGKIKGDIKAQTMLVLMPTAVLTGNVITPKLNIVEGAIFQGNCQMMESFYNIDEVAKYLEIDLSEIEELANSGKIPATKSEDAWRFDKKQIDNWAASGRVS